MQSKSLFAIEISFFSSLSPQVVKIIGDNIPQIEAVDLSTNRMRVLDHFQAFVDKAPHVKTLHLADNSVSRVPKPLE